LACGALSRDLEDSWAKLKDGKVLRKLGLELQVVTNAHQIAANNKLAQLFLDALRHLTRQFAMWELEFTQGLPFHFLRLLSTDDTEVTAVARPGFHYVIFLWLSAFVQMCSASS
jgi:hypothetical protein